MRRTPPSPDESALSRRALLARVAAGAGALAAGAALAPRLLRAQGVGQPLSRDTTPQSDAGTAAVHEGNTMIGAANVPMDQSAWQAVTLPPKPGARPQLTQADRDALEHRLACQCGCTLDVYTCRTTDFSCSVSPAMHRDVMALVAGGHSAQEIIDAFTAAYGEKVLMEPKREGFNLLGYLVPPAVLVTGTAVAWVLLRRWRLRAPVASPAATGNHAVPDATPDELARLERAVRGEGR